MARASRLVQLGGGVALLALLGIAVGGLRRPGRRAELLSVGGIYLGSFGALEEGDPAPDFPAGGDVEWLNTAGSDPPRALRGAPLTMRGLRREGKVVLVHFWDYTRMHSAMAMPALRRWSSRYSPFGVEIIGVHTSRFAFARRLVHVARAAERLGLRHPIVNDAHGDIATAYGSEEATPSMFLVGTDGRVLAVQSGLGGMEDMEYELCMAAAEQHPDLWCGPEGLRGKDVAALHAAGPGSAWLRHWIAWITWRMQRYACMLKTKDMSIGTEGGGGGSRTRSKPTDYTDLAGVVLGQGKFALSGNWKAHPHGVTVLEGEQSGMVNTHMRLRYHGKGVYALMGLEGTEHTPEHMCTDGKTGEAPAGQKCVHQKSLHECRDVAGERGIEGWCEASGGQWGGCTSCTTTGPVRVYILLDGDPVPHAMRGSDLEEDALGRTLVTVHEPRIYALIGGVRARDHGLTLRPEAPGVSVHHFSFSSECSQAPPSKLRAAPSAARLEARVA